MSDAKIYKNADRDKPIPHKKYIPQYQIRGIEPEEVASGPVPDKAIMLKSTPPLPPTNPRSSRLPVRQPYAEIVPSPVGMGKGPVPNVGNNMEHTWSSVDGEITDDFDYDSSKFIDNNFISDKQELIKSTKFSSISCDEYILLIDDNIVRTGSLDEIEKETRDLIFGDHSYGHVPVESITILKKIKIKIGVFLE